VSGGLEVIDTPSVDWFALSPSLVALGTAAICLLGAVLTPRWLLRPFSSFVCALGIVGAGVMAGLVYWKTPEGHLIVVDSAVRDRYAALAQMIVMASALLTVGVSYSARMRQDHIGEYYALLATSAAGMAFLVQAANLMTLFLGLEWFSVCLYVLCAIEIDIVGSLEAGLKYLIIGGMGSAVLLFGSALVYGSTGELGFSAIADATRANDLADDPILLVGLAMILAGLAFKASAAPFHMWTPDVYDGAPTPVTGFMAAATKTVALLLMLRLLTVAFPEKQDLWTIAVAVLACISLAWGNIAALVQNRVKRLLAYSSISHAGFMLIAIAAANQLGARALLYYLIPYSAVSVGAFAIVAARERELGETVTLDNLAGFGWERPLLGAAMLTFMLGFAGFPLTGGFMGKFLIFSAASERGWNWLVIVGVMATLVSLYYYLAVIRAMYMRPAAELGLAPVGGSPPREVLLSSAAMVAMVVNVGSFIAVQPLVDLARHATEALPL
jgi:NADH-quinone oxidoreductase subunit N